MSNADSMTGPSRSSILERARGQGEPKQYVLCCAEEGRLHGVRDWCGVGTIEQDLQALAREITAGVPTWLADLYASQADRPARNAMLHLESLARPSRLELAVGDGSMILLSQAVHRSLKKTVWCSSTNVLGSFPRA
jgi:hypothetical protein